MTVQSANELCRKTEDKVRYFDTVHECYITNITLQILRDHAVIHFCLGSS